MTDSESNLQPMVDPYEAGRKAATLAVDPAQPIEVGLARLKVSNELSALVIRFGPTLVLDQMTRFIRFVEDCQAINDEGRQ